MSEQRQPPTAPPPPSSMRQAGASAFLLYAGRRFPVAPDGVTIGRGEESDIKLSGDRASRRHARVYPDGDGNFWIADLGSRHGTLLNRQPLTHEPRRLASGDTIAFNGELIRFVSGDETRLASRELSVLETQVVRFEGERLAIGRDPSNNLVLDDPNVSRFHAEVVRTDGDGPLEVLDLASRNGTRLEGALVERATIEIGTEIGIGPFGLVFDGESFVARDERGALRIDSYAVGVVVKEKRILAPTSISIEPGEFMAIIGESGSGKSTLVRALAGVTKPTSGRILVSGQPLASRLTDIGYVPQDDIVHALLTVREALTYAARLRLPQDSSREEIDATVDRVLVELALSEHADTMVGSLSGGQRKRTSVASELLSRPSILFLDEPTTGLDPGLETKMMELMRELADRSRAVTVVTHATKNLRLCDKVIVLGRGGELTFCGAPKDALGFFGVEDFDGIYWALDERPAIEWRHAFESGGDGDTTSAAEVVPSTLEQAPARAPSRRSAKGTHALAQSRVLIRRYLQLLTRDRRNLALLLGQAPLLALFNVALFKAGLFDRPGGRPVDAIQLLFLLVIAVIWLGSIDAAREIVKEKSVFHRESAIGMRLSAYLASKAVVLFGLVGVQSLVFAGVVMFFRPLDSPTSAYLEVLAILVMTGFVSVAMGLLISSAVGTQDQAMTLNPLVLIPQLLFAGAIIPVAQMVEPVKTLSAAMFAQWSLAGVGTSIDMNGRIADVPRLAESGRFGADFFNVAVLPALLVLLAFLALFLAATVLLLHKETRR